MLNIAPLFPFFKASSLKKLQTTNRYCCRCGIHCSSCPEPLPNKVIKVKVNKQKPSDACPARLMLIAIKCPLIQRQAALEAIPLLAEVFLTTVSRFVGYYLSVQSRCPAFEYSLHSQLHLLV